MTTEIVGVVFMTGVKRRRPYLPLPPGEGGGEGASGVGVRSYASLRLTSPHPNPLPEGEGVRNSSVPNGPSPSAQRAVHQSPCVRGEPRPAPCRVRLFTRLGDVLFLQRLPS